jgi:hypothetical protein
LEGKPNLRGRIYNDNQGSLFTKIEHSVLTEIDRIEHGINYRYSSQKMAENGHANGGE